MYKFKMYFKPFKKSFPNESVRNRYKVSAQKITKSKAVNEVFYIGYVISAITLFFIYKRLIFGRG